MVVQEGDRAAGWVKLCSRQVRLPPEDRVVPDHCWTLGDPGPATNRAHFLGKDVEGNSVTSPNPNTLAKASWLKWILNSSGNSSSCTHLQILEGGEASNLIQEKRRVPTRGFH